MLTYICLQSFDLQITYLPYHDSSVVTYGDYFLPVWRYTNFANATTMC